MLRSRLAEVALPTAVAVLIGLCGLVSLQFWRDGPGTACPARTAGRPVQDDTPPGRKPGETSPARMPAASVPADGTPG